MTLESSQSKLSEKQEIISVFVAPWMVNTRSGKIGHRPIDGIVYYTKNKTYKGENEMNSMNTQELGLMVRDEKVVVSSRAVAEAFGKEHKNVMQSIRNLDCTEDFRALNFKPTQETVQMPTGGVRKDPAYLMTRDGFTFLAMGFTGPRAAVFKEAYIEAFNKMEAELKNRKQASLEDMYKAITTPDAIMQIAANWKADRERMLELEAKVIEDTPKIIFHDAITAIETSGILIKDMATILTQNGFRQSDKSLFAWLRNHGYLCVATGYWNKPKQEYVDKGYFTTRESTYYNEKTEENAVSTTTLITPLGQKHILSEFIRLYSN